jgi:Ca2+-binding RTX toxin-like protein
MRRGKIIGCLIAVAILGGVFASVALAGIVCDGGPCYGTGGDDYFKGSGHVDLIFGRGGSDSADAGRSGDVIRAGPGDDHGLEGRHGDDTYYGGAGDDSLFESLLLGGGGGIKNEGEDTMHGGKGTDEIFASFGEDHLVGGPGDEFDSGFRFGITMYGDKGDDRLNGGSGKDSMAGEEGDDVMLGGPGFDVINARYHDQRSSLDVVRCGRGTDTVRADPPDKVGASCENVDVS